jgi:hypothetical protein
MLPSSSWLSCMWKEMGRLAGVGQWLPWSVRAQSRRVLASLPAAEVWRARRRAERKAL